VISLNQLDSLEPIQVLKEAYLRSLVFPLDPYWKSAVIGAAPHWLMEVDGQQAGYFAARAEKRLLQFFVTDPFLPMASELFSFVLGGDLVQTASAGTYEPAYLAHCLDHQRRVAIRSYIFQDHILVEPLLDGYASAQFRLATTADTEKLAAFYGQNDEYEDSEAITAGFGNRLNYARSLIEQGQVFILVNEDELVGVGECRISTNQAPYADLGMITGNQHRRHGIGTYILAKLKQYCYQREAKPICSCAAENLPSRKTIEKAGFIKQHRLLDIQFSEKWPGRTNCNRYANLN
jgi:predicted acetyltransferase